MKRGLIICVLTLLSMAADAQSGMKWVTSWTGSVQGPYPIGNPSAQPDVSRIFPKAGSGARDQSFRMIVRPDIWGPRMRIRLSNALGTQPVTFDGVHVGLSIDLDKLFAQRLSARVRDDTKRVR